MALTGQLSDLSLAELIEFFCNQRKTGRLKVDYHRGHGVFFVKDGELVDAKVGALSGAEAVYFALTLPNAAFDFSADFQPSRRTINVTWTQVVLEGLRRLDEGISPSEAEAFSTEDSPAVEAAPSSNAHAGSDHGATGRSVSGKVDEGKASSDVPLSLLVDGASGGAGRSRMMLGVVVGCVLLACVVAAVPLAGRFSKSRASASLPEVAPAAVATTQPDAAPANAPGDAAPDAASAAPSQPDAAAVDAAADAARREAREREARVREARERERRAEETAKKETAASEKAATPAAAPSGPKTVRVSVAYDEAGRVTQASVAGASPGGEAYSATAVRIARGRRFPAGKAGSTVVTIPFN